MTHVRKLLKGFNSRSDPVARRIPTWDFSLVLSFLVVEENSSPFLTVHLLLANTIFLLSQASAGRCKLLAALENKVATTLFYKLVTKSSRSIAVSVTEAGGGLDGPPL